ADARDMRDVVARARAGEQLGHDDTAPDLDTLGLLGRARNRSLRDRAARGNRGEIIAVAVAHAAGYFWRQHYERVQLHRTKIHELLAQLGKVLVHQRAKARREIMNLAELRDAAALPVSPRVLRVGWSRRRVALEHRDVVTVACQ